MLKRIRVPSTESLQSRRWNTSAVKCEMEGESISISLGNPVNWEDGCSLWYVKPLSALAPLDVHKNEE